VQGCTFHDSEGILFDSEGSANVNVNNSIFYRGVRILARMVDGEYNTFTNNLLINVRVRKIQQLGGPIGNLYNWAVLGAFYS